MEIVCKHHDEILNVDEKQLVTLWNIYLKCWNLGDIGGIEKIQKCFIAHYLNDFGDPYACCDNVKEVREQLFELLVATLRKSMEEKK